MTWNSKNRRWTDYEEFDFTEVVNYHLKEKKFMFKKTDIVFFLSMLVLVWDKVGEMVKPLVPVTLFSWLSVVAVVVATVSYALYSKFTGTTEVQK